LAVVKTVRKKKLYIELISPDVVNTTTAVVVRPSKMFVVKVGSNIIHIRVIKEIDEFIFGRRTVNVVLCIKITKNNRMKIKLRGLLDPVNYCVLGLVADSSISR